MPEREAQPTRNGRRDPADGDILRDTVVGNLPEGLVPLRMNTPEVNEGLRVLSFSDGLEELTANGMRRGPRKQRNIPGDLDADQTRRYTAISADDF